MQSTEISLENLGGRPIDLQQLHVWTDEWAGDERWQRAVDDLKRQKTDPRLRDQRESLAAVERASRARDGARRFSVQVVYNLFDQNPEDELFPMCRERGVAVIARVPFDEGSLTGTMTPGMTWPEGDWRNLYFTPDKLDETLDRVGDITRRPAARHDAAGAGAALHPGLARTSRP